MSPTRPGLVRWLDSKQFRSAALATIVSLAPLLTILFSGCDDGVERSTPTAPPLGNSPSSPPPPPTTLPVSETATPGKYERVTPHSPEGVQFHGGSLESRFVVASDGSFSLEYESASFGRFAYAGTYARAGDLYDFAFEGWSTAGPWLASASFGGTCLEVRFNLVMQLSDFEDGRFCR